MARYAYCMGYTPPIQIQMHAAFESLARDGAARYRARTGTLPALSHFCFRFSGFSAYDDWVIDAAMLGTLTRQRDQGGAVQWCHLFDPLRAGTLALHWLLLCHPETGARPVSGLSAICYHVPGLAEKIVLPSADSDIDFYYQGASAAEIVHP